MQATLFGEPATAPAPAAPASAEPDLASSPPAPSMPAASVLTPFAGAPSARLAPTPSSLDPSPAPNISAELEAELAALLNTSPLELGARVSVDRLRELMEAEARERSASGEVTRKGWRPGVAYIGLLKVKGVSVPRLKARDGSFVPLRTYAAFNDPASRVHAAFDLTALGMSSHKIAEHLEKTARGWAKAPAQTTISRWLRDAMNEQHDEIMTRPCDDLVVVYVDAMSARKHGGICTIALGVDSRGVKRTVAVMPGASESTEVAAPLMRSLATRDIPPWAILVMDGSQALREAARNELGEDVIVQSCVHHIIRTVVSKLPRELQRRYRRRLRYAWRRPSYDLALARLMEIFEELGGLGHHAAAASLVRDLDLSLTCQLLGVPRGLLPSVDNTNMIESENSGVRRFITSVPRWDPRDEYAQLRRWFAGAITYAERGFTRLRQHELLPSLCERAASHVAALGPPIAGPRRRVPRPATPAPDDQAWRLDITARAVLEALPTDGSYLTGPELVAVLDPARVAELTQIGLASVIGGIQRRLGPGTIVKQKGLGLRRPPKADPTT